MSTSPVAPAADDIFDRFLRYDELVAWLHRVADDHPELVTLDCYGTSYEGRDLWLVTVTDAATGGHHAKPAHWVDASIHATELTATVAACALIRRLVDGYGTDDGITRALQTRTFYVVPRVNPDGAEWALADRPRFRRSSTRPWPWRDGRDWPGLHVEDIDADGRILQMRIADPHGAWMGHPDDERVMVPVPADGAPRGVATYRLLDEGRVVDHDGFTIPTPPATEGLDLNRNYPAGWGTSVTGSGDHPLSEPEIDALVRAFVARPNICGANAFHTSGGLLLRPSSTRPDAKLAPLDLWIWNRLAERGTELTGCPAHSVFEDFTWDPNETMSGAADDWAYEHLGVFAWTTEFWDIVDAATGTKQATDFWYLGPTREQTLAVLHWCDEHHPDGHVDWYPFEHPTLGPVELGGWNLLTTWSNPPPSMLRQEVEGHADFAVHQAMCSPHLEITYVAVDSLGEGLWSLDVGICNTGWLATDISSHARKERLVAPLVAELSGDTIELVGSLARQQLGQLDGRAAARFSHGNDGTPNRALARWTVRASPGAVVTVTATHPRCGIVTRDVTLET
ncbi:MAG: M14 family metallopeptidase [Ilumatobacter sp.]|uniref:M14 family metallopeptidase n=1 Tax=Ilumatobacter sp. TaxID=1967498 RepID=UPI00391B70DB